MVYYCVYNNCKSNSRRIKSRKVRYYPFPKPKKNLVKCLLWIELCGNRKLTIDKVSKNTFVCSKHFVRGVADPKPFSTETVEVGKIVEVGSELHSENVDILLPMENVESYGEKHTRQNDECIMPTDGSGIICDYSQEHNYSCADGNEGDQLDCPPSGTCEDLLYAVASEDEIGSHESDDCPPSGSCGQPAREDSPDNGEQSTMDGFLKNNKFSYENLEKNPEEFKYFCGLEMYQFEALYNFLDESVMSTLKYSYKNDYEKKHSLENNRVSKLSNKDKLCLTLVRLRRGFTLVEMSYFCGLSKSYVSVIFFTWVQFMYHQIISVRGDLILKGRNIQEVPYCFKNFDGQNVNFVLDATEISMEMPSNFRHQGNTFSSYKHSNTIKFLVMICSSGGIVYCSDGFEGSISDVELFEKSDIRVFLQENDVILADRGFLIRDLCDEINVKLYIPPFLMERDKLTAEEERMTKKIAKARIHVERAIGRIKSYRILSKRCPILLLPIISNIFTIICFLVNFQQPLL